MIPHRLKGRAGQVTLNNVLLHPEFADSLMGCESGCRFDTDNKFEMCAAHEREFEVVCAEPKGWTEMSTQTLGGGKPSDANNAFGKCEQCEKALTDRAPCQFRGAFFCSGECMDVWMEENFHRDETLPEGLVVKRAADGAYLDDFVRRAQEAAKEKHERDDAFQATAAMLGLAMEEAKKWKRRAHRALALAAIATVGMAWVLFR